MRIFTNYGTVRARTLELGATNMREYHEVREKYDLRLPRRPMDLEGWRGLKHFFGKFYATHGQAARAAQKLELKDKEQYKSEYKKDPLLPSSPDQVYAGIGWRSWDYFLGVKKEKKEEPPRIYKYRKKTYSKKELVTYLAKEGITTWPAYKEAYKYNKNLPSTPFMKYPGWSKWSDIRKAVENEMMNL